MKILADPSTVRRLADQGLDPQPTTPSELAAFMQSETDRFSRIVKLSRLATAQ